MKTKKKPDGGSLERRVRARRIYACLSASESLEAAAQCVLQRRAATGVDDSKEMQLLEECRVKAWTARQDADAAMHEMGIGYNHIYP